MKKTQGDPKGLQISENVILSLDIERVPIDSVKPYKRNARRGNAAIIRESLERHGQFKPLIVRRKTREILAGNHTWQEAKDLGWQDIAVSFVDVDARQAKRILLVDNRASDAAGYDYEALHELLTSLPSLEGTGFDEDAVREVLAELEDDPADGLTDPDDVPALPGKPTTKPGDLWRLGDHRLICGDATDGTTIERLCDGSVEAVWTDPPYNVNYQGGTIENDDLEANEFAELLERALTAALEVTIAGGPIYVCHAELSGMPFQAALLKAGWLHKQTLIWVKNTFTLGRQDYQWQHEPMLYGWKPGAAHRWYGGFDGATVVDDEPDVCDLDKAELRALVKQLRNERRTSVIREDKPSRSDLHPTMKPVKLIEGCLQNSTQRGDAVLDPFGGSGSTLIAAERLGRQGRLAELDPRYCDVIVRRWEEFAGGKAERG